MVLLMNPKNEKEYVGNIFAPDPGDPVLRDPGDPVLKELVFTFVIFYISPSPKLPSECSTVFKYPA